MLTFFPTPYPDELLYGICARYHQRSGHTSAGHTMRDLFGNRQAATVIDLPTRINSIVERLHPQTLHTAATLINAHTMFPLYRPFIPTSRAERITRLMTGETRTGNVHMAIGQTASVVTPLKFLRFCPLCLRADEHNYGEPYWHRSHQVPGVPACHLHHVWLADSDVAVGGMRAKQSLVVLDPEMMMQQQPLREAREFFHYSWLAAAAHQLLNGLSFERTLGLAELRRRYLHHLYCKGLASATGRMEGHRLVESFLDFYGTKFLAALHCGIATGHADNWLLALVRKPLRAAHPLQHLLLIRFLGLEIKDFLLGEVSKHSLFGSGPWPCLNPAASHFRRAVVGACTITRNTATGAPVGTFICKCGFTYSRNGPDRCRSDRSRVDRIVAMGLVWEERLSYLILTEKMSFSAVARQLEVDVKTVQRHLELLSKKTAGVTVPQSFSNDKELNRRRANWQDLCAANPGIGTRALRHLQGADYAWLYRRDRAWLQAHLPERRPPLVHKGRVDWPERDSYLSSLVEQAAKTLRQLSGRPTRVTVTSIWTQLGESGSLCKKLAHLPSVRAVLETVLENKDEFAIRRLQLAAGQLRQKNEPVTAWKLVRKAGLRQSYHDAVAKELERLTTGTMDKNVGRE